MRYTVSAAGCASAKRAAFVAFRVVTLDSQGHVDTLTNVNYVKVEPTPPVPLSLHAVYPPVLVQGQSRQIAIDGEGFTPESTVLLRQGSTAVSSGSVTVVSDRILAADVTGAFTNGQPVDLVVAPISGPNATLVGGLTQLAVGGTSGAAQGPPWKPSNDARAFTPVSLDSVDFESPFPYQPVHGVSHPWPASLNSDTLLVASATGRRVALVPSRPFAGVGLLWNVGNPATIAFRVNPPIRASSIGTLLQGGQLFAGSGTFADIGTALVDVSLNSKDGLQVQTFSPVVGQTLRNWQAGGLYCSYNGTDSTGFKPYYSSPLADTLVVALDSQSGHNYDFQEMRLSPAARVKKLSRVAISGRDRQRSEFCSNGSTDGTSSIHGVVVWPEFEIADSLGAHVTYLSQGNPAWRDKGYGGFYRNGQLLGTRKTIGINGCNLTCYAMANCFFGIPVTPDSLNHYLQLHGGYGADPTGVVSGITDTTLSFRYTGASRLRIKDTVFVVASVGLKPIAVVVVRDTVLRVAGVVQLLEPQIPIVSGQAIVTFGLVNPAKASQLFSNNKWTLDNLSWQTTRDGAALAESTLCSNQPLILKTKLNHPNVLHPFDHYVLATGWVPAFAAANVAHGTYVTMNPGSAARARLIDAPQGNEFLEPRPCRLLSQGQHLQSFASAAATATLPATLSISVSANATLYVEDPQGHTARFDPDRGEYLSDILGLTAFHGEQVDDEEDATLVSNPAEMFTLIAPAVGTYNVVVNAMEDGDVPVIAAACDDAGQVVGDLDLPVVGSGNQAVYRLTYSEVGGAAAHLERLRVTAVSPSAESGRLRLRVLGNPGNGPIAFECVGGSGVLVEVEVYDVGGRRIRALSQSATSDSNPIRMRWNGETESGTCAGNGVYFIRVRRGPELVTSRAILIR